jgi:membrane-associated phospholipid phosphatase
MKFYSHQRSVGRRDFLAKASRVIFSAIGLDFLAPQGGVAKGDETMRTKGSVKNPRVHQAYEIRRKAAQYQRDLPLARQETNGDEDLYPNRIGNYSKGLPHDAYGDVDPEAYEAMRVALKTSRPEDFESIPLGGALKLTNPQAAFAYELEGPDPHQVSLRVPPAFNSAQQAGEIAELYWQALLRDVPFNEYGTHPLANEAAVELSKYPDFSGSTKDNRVSADTLFRGFTPGDRDGPYVSQFLWKDVPYGSTPIIQKIRTAKSGIDYMVDYGEWFSVQRGFVGRRNQIDTTRRYIRSGRDLSSYVQVDQLYTAFLNAGLILLGMGAPLNRGNPYRTSKNQTGFATFGGPSVLDLVARVANCSLKAAWYQKWLVHRRARPEELAGRIHNHLTGTKKYPLPQEILDSAAPEKVFQRYESYLLPMAYPEGCPTHPAYPAGHAVIAGACATALKAFFDESYQIRDPVTASSDGLSLVPYQGALTVGGELNKLASNISIGRNFAGIHWRSDYTGGIELGEAVALGVLRDMRECFNERFEGFVLTKFDGTKISV